MNRLSRLGVNLVATFFIWMAAGMTDVITGGSGATRDSIMIIVILAAFGLTAALWLIWALTDFSEHTSPANEKTKREDARVALLLELMGEDERQALKQRLVDDLGGDGEAISLAQLLAAQEDDRR